MRMLWWCDACAPGWRACWCSCSCCVCAGVRVSVRPGGAAAVHWSVTWLLSNCNWNMGFICHLRLQQPKFNLKSFKAVWVARWWLNHFQNFTPLFSSQSGMCRKSGSCKMMFECTKQFWLGWKGSWGLAARRKRGPVSHMKCGEGWDGVVLSWGWVMSHLLNLLLYCVASLWKCKIQLFSCLGSGEAGKWIWTLYSPWSVLAPLL